MDHFGSRTKLISTVPSKGVYQKGGESETTGDQVLWERLYHLPLNKRALQRKTDMIKPYINQ